LSVKSTLCLNIRQNALLKWSKYTNEYLVKIYHSAQTHMIASTDKIPH